MYSVLRTWNHCHTDQFVEATDFVFPNSLTSPIDAAFFGLIREIEAVW